MSGPRQKTLYAIVFSVLAALSSAASAASHNNAEAPKDGKTVLGEMKLANFEQLAGNFKQTKTLKELDVEIKTEGSFQVAKQADGASVFHWNIAKPKPSRICIDSVGLVIDSGDGDLAKKKNLKFSEVGKEVGDQIASLLKMITMDQNKITEEFTIEKHDKVFTLVPKIKAGAFFESATLEVNKAGLVQAVSLKEKSQDEIQIHFSDLTPKNRPAAKDEQCLR